MPCRESGQYAPGYASIEFYPFGQKSGQLAVILCTLRLHVNIALVAQDAVDDMVQFLLLFFDIGVTQIYFGTLLVYVDDYSRVIIFRFTCLVYAVVYTIG